VTNPVNPKIWAPVKGVPPGVQWVETSVLMIDADYQRCIATTRSQTLIARIAAGFDWRLCWPLMVSDRDGQKYVVDGQHRLMAARMRGDIAHMPCLVTNFENLAEEAALFVTANRKRIAASRIDTFRAAVLAGDKNAIVVDRLVREAGLRVAAQREIQAGKTGAIFCITPLFTGVRKYGAGVTSAALNAVASIGRDQAMRVQSNLIQGLLLLFSSPPADFDPDRLEDILPRYTVEEWSTHPDVALYGTNNGGTHSAMRRTLIAEMADYGADVPECSFSA
jgi:ParB-like nuclease domain